VIDHAPQTAANSQSTVVDARTLEALESIEACDALIRRGLTIARFILCDRDDELFAVDFSELPVRHPYMLMVPESSAEAVLAERFACYGSSVLRPVTAVALEQDADGVTVELWDGRSSRTGSPSRRSIRARYVVGCDGAHSQIRSALEIPFVGSPRTEWFVMADVRMRLALPRRDVQLYFSPSGILVVAPLPDDRYRILATVEHAAEHPDADTIRAILAARGPRRAPAFVHDVAWSTGIGVDHRLAMHYRSGRVFLAGDAAHMHSPAGGQGMNAGIQDALYLANMLSDVVARRVDEAVLKDYERARRPVAESGIRLTRRLSGIATMHGPWGIKVRNRMLRFLGYWPPARQHLAYRIAGYSRGPIVPELTAARPSERPESAGLRPSDEMAKH
jgi:2-polyprenyl-6-methoxyphenol hydroxylase-like FAD-dependent oxidoreductase